MQYLAWGGESEGVSLVTPDEIAKDQRQGHYSGSYNWDRFASVELLDGQVVAEPAELRSGTAGIDYDEDDYGTATAHMVLARTGAVLDTMSWLIDGRA